MPSGTVSKSRTLIVNASYTSGLFYQKDISGLSENTTYEFSEFLENIYNRSSSVCENGGIPVNVRFEIWDESNSILLKEGSTGAIRSGNSLNMEKAKISGGMGPSPANRFLTKLEM